MTTKQELANLVIESRKINERMLNAIKDYIKENKSSFLETNIGMNNHGQVFLNGISTEEVSGFVEMTLRVCSFNEDYENVMAIGIEEVEFGEQIYYLYDGDTEVHVATLDDVPTNQYENLIELLIEGEPFDTDEMPEIPY